jgi:RNA polymerase sigma-70 factor, ECF subfamily
MSENGEGQLGTLTDEELLAGCQKNDRAAWGEFVSRYSNLIYYVIKFRCGYKGDEADDIYQSVFVKVLRSIGKVREKTKLRSWLLAVTWNECIDFNRKRSVQYRFFVAEEPRDNQGHFEQEYYLSLREMLDLFQKAFTRLSPRHQEILSEKYKGSTVDEIARKLDIPKGSIYYNHKKACKELSEVLTSMNYSYADMHEAMPQLLLNLD